MHINPPPATVQDLLDFGILAQVHWAQSGPLKRKCTTHQTSWRHEAVERSLSESAGFGVPEKESDFNKDKELDAAYRSNNELII